MRLVCLLVFGLGGCVSTAPPARDAHRARPLAARVFSEPAIAARLEPPEGRLGAGVRRVEPEAAMIR